MMMQKTALAAALLLGLSTAAFAGAATDDAWRISESGSAAAPTRGFTPQLADAAILADGYSVVTHLTWQGDSYSAMAMKDGKVVPVTVYATGKVYRTH